MVGANGAGKSTLLSLIAGEVAPTTGRLILDPPGAAVARCRQEVDASTSEIEAFALAEDGQSRRWMGLLEIDPSSIQRWETLSPGERKRWQLGAALASDPHILLLDEPTNHLDAAARTVVEPALARFDGVGLVISHDRGLLDRLTVRTLRVHRGSLRLWSAPYSVAREAWLEEEEVKRRHHAQIRRREKALKRRLADERRAADQRDAGFKRRLKTSDPKDHDARSMAAKGRHESGKVTAQRRRTVIRAGLEWTKRAAADLTPEKVFGGSIFFDFEPSPKRHLLRFSGPLKAGSKELADHVEVEVRRNDRIRLVGPNGVGKTTLLEGMMGSSRLPEDRVLYLPQELSRNDGAHLLSGLDELTPERRGRVLAVVAALGIDPDELLMSARPSPGEARKLAIALGLGVGVWLMVLDEPTNHLDLPSVERVEEALEAYPGALVVVTHDDTFGVRTTKTIWRFESGVLRVGEGDQSPSGLR